MQTFYSVCPCCQSFDFEILFPSFSSGKIDAIEDIDICRQCGVVGRNPFVERPIGQFFSMGWWSEPELHRPRLQQLVEIFERENVLPAGDDFHLEIGSGPGWFTEELYRGRNRPRLICLEPVVEVAAEAKKSNSACVVLPCTLERANLPEGAFKLITALNVDVGFADFTCNIEKISRLLTDDGIFYVERNVFIPQDAWLGSPILDHEDFLGLTPWVHTYFGKDQFVEVLSKTFDIENVVERSLSSFTYRGRERTSLAIGVFCRKKRVVAQARPLTNFYDSHLSYLQNVAVTNSIEDLRSFVSNGVKNIAICGAGVEAVALGELLEKNDICKVNGYLVHEQDSQDCLKGRPAEVLRAQKALPAAAILIASLNHYTEYEQKLTDLRWQNRMFSVFRPGLQVFDTTTSRGNKIQLKAFLPQTVAELDKREARIKMAGAAH